jgi:glycosyltransferase involved in cell wall biosynthesis
MKIAHIVCRYKPYKGGISNIAYEYAEKLSQLDHAITVFTPLYDNIDNDLTTEKYKIERIKPWFKFGNAAFIPQLLFKLKKFDIVHLHYPFFGASCLVWLLKIIKGKKFKLVISYHMDVVGGGALKIFFSGHSKLIMPMIIKSADKVVISSDDYAQNGDLQNIFKKYPDKFTIIPPSVDLERFNPTDKDHDLFNKYSLSNSKVVLFVGGLDKAHYFKGLEFLIKSFAKFNNNVKLVIVGSGDLKNNYQAQVAKANLQQKIFFAGKVSDEDLPKYYNLADLVVLPSIDKSEAFGIVLIEAMACAKPVVTSDLAGVRSVYNDQVSGLVFKLKDSADLAEKVNKILGANELQGKMGQAAIEKVKSTYDLNILIKKLETIYEDMFDKQSI